MALIEPARFPLPQADRDRLDDALATLGAAAAKLGTLWPELDPVTRFRLIRGTQGTALAVGVCWPGGVPGAGC